MRAMAGFVALIALALPALGAEPLPKVTVKVDPTVASFFVDGVLVTKYHTGPKQSKPWFYPLNVLPDKGVTRPWPIEDVGDEKKDHVHHRSLWFCHGDVIPEGMDYIKSGDKRVKGVDFWSEGMFHGRIVQVGHMVLDSGDGLHGSHVWKEPGGKSVLRQDFTYRLVPLGKGRNLLLMDITLKALDHALTFNDTKEGSLGVRVRKTIALETKGSKGEMVNDRGESGERAVWGKVAKWCDYSGPLGPDGPVGGITIMASPKNTIDTAWHSRAYGLMAANPFGREASFPGRKGQKELVKIAKGESLKLRFGVYLHAGNAKDGGVAEAYTAFTKIK